MIKLLDINFTKELWDKIYKQFCFNPSINVNVEPFSFNMKFKCYKLSNIWDENQENFVNEVFKNISLDNIYALDWNHDCFEYNPHNYQRIDKQWFDKERNCNVYFPTYYPNGDYFFFISKDFSYGLFGHPWRKEIYVFGDTLIEVFEINQDLLQLV